MTTYITVKLLIEAGSQIQAGSPIQAYLTVDVPDIWRMQDWP